jgi:hypothetical protein
MECKWDKIIEKGFKEDPNISIAFATKHGIPQVQFYRVRRRLQGQDKGAAKGPPKKPQKSSIDSFLNQYDDSVIIPGIIEAGIKKHRSDSNGNPCWLKDKDFRELCDVSMVKWRRFADLYKELQVMAQGELVWGHEEIIAEMRRAVQR